MEDTPIPRLVEFDDVSSMAGIMMYACRMRPQPSDALMVLTGLGEHERVRYGIRLLRLGWASYLLIAGMNEEQNKDFGPYTKDWLSRYLKEHEMDRTFVLEEAPTILDQVNWALDIAEEQGFGSMIVTASFYHLPRGFFTIIKAAIKRRMILKIFPIFPKPAQDEHFLIPAEVKRILRYQKKGDVVTLPELLAYIMNY